MKDSQWSIKHPRKTTCQMLLMTDYDWFKNYRGDSTTSRLEGYDELKQKWSDICVQIFLYHFPLCKDKLEVVDISTPLSIEHYLNAHRGAAVGMDVLPSRFVDPIIREQLDPVSNIPGLYLTGQDTTLCGVTLCQLSGVITAFRMVGFFSSLKILTQSILLGN